MLGACDSVTFRPTPPRALPPSSARCWRAQAALAGEGASVLS